MSLEGISIKFLGIVSLSSLLALKGAYKELLPLEESFMSLSLG